MGFRDWLRDWVGPAPEPTVMRRDINYAFGGSGPFGEVAQTDPTFQNLGSVARFNPDALVMKKGLKIFDEMSRDDQVHAALEIKKRFILGTGWEVLVSEEQMAANDPEAERKRDFVDFAFNRLGNNPLSGTSFDYDLEEILTAMDYGYSITEKIMDRIADDKNHEFGGMVGIKALKTRKPHFFRFHTDDYGNLLKDGIVQETSKGIDRFDPAKFILYTYQPRFDNRYGTSDLVPVYREWWNKNIVTRLWTISLERHGEPLIDAAFKGSMTGTEQTAIVKMLKNMSGRKYFFHPEEVDIDLKEANLRGAQAFKEAIQQWNLGIARGLLIPKHLGITESGEVGTLAQAQQNFTIFRMVIERIRIELEERVIRNQLIRPLLAMNFENPEPLPDWRLKPLPGSEAQELTELWLASVTGGAVKGTLQDEAHIRDLTGFPKREPTDEEVEFEEEMIKNPEPPTMPDQPEGLDAPSNPPKAEEKEKPIPREMSTGEAMRLIAEADGEEIKTYADNQFSVAVDFLEWDKLWERAEDVCTLHEHAIADDPLKVQRKTSNRQESRFGFPAVARGLNDIMALAEEQMLNATTRMKDEAIKFSATGTVTAKDINDFDFSAGAKGQLRRATTTMMVSAFEFGRERAALAVSKGTGRRTLALQDITVLTPTRALREFRRRGEFVATGVTNDLLKVTGETLYTGIKTGAKEADIAKDIAEKYEMWARTEELTGSASAEASTAHRINNVIRTNTMAAFNGGSLSEYVAAGKRGFVEAVQFSAVMDDRTTEVCAFTDGKTLPINHPGVGSMTPPLHFQCRSILVPVLAAEKWLPMMPSEFATTMRLSDSKFTGA